MAVLCALNCINKHRIAGRLPPSSVADLTVEVHSDNTVTVAALNSGYSKNPILLTLVADIWVCAARLGFVLRAQWLPGVGNCVADYLSRLEVGDTWGLSWKWFCILVGRWGSVTVDCMAAY